MSKPVTAKAVRDHYDDLAPVYDRQWAALDRAVRHWVMDRFPPGLPAGAKVLDAGCGTGRVLADIAEEWPLHRLTGIDLSPGMLARARERAPEATLTEGDLNHTTFPRHEYDVVLSLNVLHHMGDPAAHLRALCNSCALGGTIFLCDTAAEGFSLKLAEKHWRRFDPAYAGAFDRVGLLALLAALPLKIIDQSLLRPDIFWRLQIYQLERTP